MALHRFLTGIAMNVPCLRSPIILVHGLFGFDQIKMGDWTVLNYFPGIPELLRSAGNRVLVARLSPTDGVAQRAAELKAFLDREVPAEPVHIFAHSMGGLDSRYMISRLGMAERVLTLTTLGTPHRGTAFADWGLKRLERLVKPMLKWLSVPHQAFYDLTTDRCRLFNDEAPDAPGVRYFSVAGRHDGDWRSLEWQIPHQIVLHAEGPNDGVVSVASANYGERCDVWDGDHLSLVNMVSPNATLRWQWTDRSQQYGGLVQRLADEGF